MKSRWKRLSVLLMALMMMLSSQANVWAQIEATPQAVPTEETTTDESSQEASTPVEEEGTAEATETATADSDELPTDDPSVQPQDMLTNYGLEPFTYDTALGQMTVTVTFPVGFTAHADAGFDPDYLVLSYGGYGDGDFTVDSVVSTSSNEFAVTVDSSNQSIKLTTNATFTVSGSELKLIIVLAAPITWDTCEVTANGYTQVMSLQLLSYGSPYYYLDLNVDGNLCTGVGYPVMEWVDYDISYQEINLYLDLSESIPADHVITVTYPTDKLIASTTPVVVYAYNYNSNSNEPIATAVAANGVITITFTQSADTDGWNTSASFVIPATLLYTCEPDAIEADTGEFVFVADPGGTFVQDSTTVLCSTNPPTKTGEWSTDENGNDVIIWTIDTGDIFNGGWVNDSLYRQPYLFNCDTFEVELVSGDRSDQGCSTDNLWADFYGDVPVRGIITVTTYPVEPATSYLNCAAVRSSPNDGEGPFIAIAANNTGWGGEVCYELFPEDGGDFINKTVDKDTVRSGGDVTYTVTVTTTSDKWSDITLTDPLPEGFTLDPASIRCDVDGEEYASDPCYELNGNTITVTAVPETVMMEGWPQLEAGPVTITLTFRGWVVGDPGDVITNEACSVRTYQMPEIQPSASMGDPTIPGGGVICSSASTTILDVVIPGPVTFVDFACDVTPQVNVPEDANGIRYATEGQVVRGGTVTVYAEIDSSVSSWGELAGTGWTPVEGRPNVVSQTFHISDDDCRTPVVPVVTFTEATCEADATASPESIDGIGYATVTEIGAGKTFVLYAKIDLTTHKWGDLTGTGWEPVEGDPSSVKITHTFAAAPDCRTPLLPPVVIFTEATCTEDAQVSAEPIDGITLSTVTEIGAGKTFVLYATIDTTKNTWGDLTGTGWEPVEGDPSMVMITHTFAAAPDCRTPLLPPVVIFTEATCTEDAQVSADPADGITLSTVTEIGAGKTFVLYATIDTTKNTWGDLTGTGWEPVEGDPSMVMITHTFAAAPDCRTPLLPPVVTFTEATCDTDAKVSAEPVDGVDISTVTEIGAGKTFVLYATIDTTKNTWGDLTGTGWEPVEGDPSTVMITHTFAAAPDCTTPSPSPSPTVPGATPTEPGATATATATQAVTGLPNTGSGQGGIGTALMWSALGMIASSALLVGIRIRRNESDVREITVTTG